ncbi:MAG: hypothetical protein PHD01_13975 [Geobacteraceae bacterium]|nr:hypothetical protein [Geobacteraceae bacterium]
MPGGALNVGGSPIEVKEIVYQAVPYVGIAKVFDFINIGKQGHKAATGRPIKHFS